MNRDIDPFNEEDWEESENDYMFPYIHSVECPELSGRLSYISFSESVISESLDDTPSIGLSINNIEFTMNEDIDYEKIKNYFIEISDNISKKNIDKDLIEKTTCEIGEDNFINKRKLVAKIYMASNIIAMKCRYGAGNSIIISEKLLNIIGEETISNFNILISENIGNDIIVYRKDNDSGVTLLYNKEYNKYSILEFNNPEKFYWRIKVSE